MECTKFQAEDHAAEITARLGVPCLPLTTGHLAGRRLRVPRHVHTLLTTGFHRAEVAALADPPDLLVAEAPIEFSRRQAADLAALARPIVMLGIDRNRLARFAEDLADLLVAPDSAVSLRETDSDALPDALAKLLAPGENDPACPVVLLSSTLWEAAGSWREHGLIHPIRYQIRSDAWPLIADALGLPLGDPG